MKKKIIILSGIGIISVATYVVSDASKQGQNIVQAASDAENVTHLANNAPDKIAPIAKIETAMSKPTTKSISPDEVFDVWGEIKTLLTAGKIDIGLEKQLINSLKQTSNPQILAEISQLLQQPDANLTSRNQEYLLSLLAVVNTHESVSLLLDTLENTPITDSNAIYSAKKSLQKIARSDTYLSLFESTFSNMDSDNLFLPDIANAIAKNASESSFDFIINQIDSLGDKSSIAMNSMENITQEKLVPKLQQIINSRDPNSELSQVSLTTLANMGQYEAAAALIQWSASQPPSADKLVTELFNSAVNKSPSAYRAIEKELNSYDFSSSEIKKTIKAIYSARQ
jgi:hypothetical protein